MHKFYQHSCFCKVREWLQKHPRFNMHFTPTSASWLNMVERFFRDLTTERLRRGVFRCVPELICAIKEYIAVHNKDPKRFVWTAMREYLYDHLTGADSVTIGYYRKPALHRVLAEYIAGRTNHEKLLWSLLNLELWHRQYSVSSCTHATVFPPTASANAAGPQHGAVAQ
jgi:hypothetical protein